MNEITVPDFLTLSSLYLFKILFECFRNLNPSCRALTFNNVMSKRLMVRADPRAVKQAAKPHLYSRYWTGTSLQPRLMRRAVKHKLHRASISSKVQSYTEDTHMASFPLTLDSLVWFRPLWWHQSNISARLRKQRATVYGTKTKLQKRTTLKSTSASPGKNKTNLYSNILFSRITS